MRIKNKKILITAGPTWVPLDSVRVISNTATGETGLLLADKLARAGARVTLIAGPGVGVPASKKIKVIHFNFFFQLEDIIFRQLKAGRYDVVIHSAAVSDYEPVKVMAGKVKSGLGSWKVILKPTPKIIDCIKKIAPRVFLVGFKFQPGAGKSMLTKSAKALMRRADLDLTVANTAIAGKYRAYILSGNKISQVLISKERLVSALINGIRRF